MKALAATAAVVMALFLAAVSWLAISSDPLDGEPYAFLALDPSSRPGTVDAPRPRANARARSARANSSDIPRPTPNASGDALEPPPGLSVIGLNTPGLAVQAQEAAPAPGTDEAAATRHIVLAHAPIDALVEESDYGALPRVSDDGRRPSAVYARPSPYTALPRSGEPARIAILIGGLGLSELTTTEAIDRLPGAVTLAFGPYGRNLSGWVRRARSAGHEVMLQIPLEPFDYPDNDPGPHTLLTNLPPEENMKRLRWLMARFTGYTGVTNHMGAKFVAARGAFQPVLEELKSRGLIYFDDGTSARSSAGEIAQDLGLGHAAAQVAIDAQTSSQEIERALAKLVALAKEKGLAIGVGSSLPITIQMVAKWSETLAGQNVVLIPVSAAVTARHQS